MQLGLAGPFSDSQCAGGLGVTEAINADEYQGMARPFRQSGDGALDIERRRAACGIRAIRQAVHGFPHLVRGPQALAPGKYAIHGDFVEPSREAAAALESR